MEWGAADSPAGSAMSCPGTQGWPWSHGGRGGIYRHLGLDANQYHSLPQASGGPWPSPPASTLVRVRGQAGLHLGFLPLHAGCRTPGSPFSTGLGGQSCSLTPEAGRQFLSSAREGLVPNQRGVQKGNGVRPKEDVLVLTEEKL